MDQHTHFDKLATAIGSSTRISMLLLLMEGRALTAKELAISVGIEPGTATAHLNQLIENKLIMYVTQGRFKYFRLLNDEVAHLLEAMMVVAPPISVKRTMPDKEMCKARYCYDHLAGELGTALYKAFSTNQFIITDNNIHITDKCFKWMKENNIHYDESIFYRRKPISNCLDWSERTFHIGGALGAILAEHFIKIGWISKTKGSRIVSITQKGHDGLRDLLSIHTSI
ncbi:ArsR/SmtB family transcription factor [[Enterobacter] lignolyticus]|uniref:HTH arsR-type domain-containing protein n=1 Tax=[Enterobacter] lignolyticus TaxID=1334193 RepID=A0A806X8Y8_9ENTR|nr:winged helix-turn-helix domain-containing protein [[Enterobacter] lignolyticus]ALR75051.1 hypothetical protein AO703_01570 [[Enterobacter] lignolyticus]